MERKSTLRWSRVVGALALGASFLLPATAAAEVILVEKDGWTVYINGRIQAFMSYAVGNGHPNTVQDANGNTVTLQGGGVEPSAGVLELPEVTADNDPGRVEELRVRTGFTGNVLGFGIKKQINKDTEVLGYSAVTTYIESTDRRKYLEVRPDWRQSFMKISGPWGAFTAGRDLVLYNRGATEITFLYGFKYGLGWPGNISFTGPTAGHCGFGVLCNGFAAGMTYATPNLAGAQLTVGIYDANTLVGTVWERVRWPRGEFEATFDSKIGDAGMFKIFANGAWQLVYQKDSLPEDAKQATIAGIGGGGRVEVGPVHFGVAGHYGQGVGLNFALEPTQAVYYPGDGIPGSPDYLKHPLRTFDGLYAQLMVSPVKVVDIMAGAGISRVKLLSEDTEDVSNDNDMNPATPPQNDDPNPAVPDSVGHVPVKQQIGISGGVAYHASDNIHLQLDYFRAMFNWYAPSPSVPNVDGPSQAFHVVNAGITYDF